jgi:molybdate transport system regulatory protein
LDGLRGSLAYLAEAMARVSLRLGFADEHALGPGKVRLLELIGETGSISAAGRAMKMSYRRAWMLVDELNRMFRDPLVEARPGGAHGGGASLTEAGGNVTRWYREIEANVQANSGARIAALEEMLIGRKPAPAKRRGSRTSRGSLAPPETG